MAPTKMFATTFELVKLFFDMWVKHHKMPQFIVSDRDAKFMKGFWKKIFQNLSFSVTFHPQIKDQTKKVNGVLNQYLKNYVGVDQKDWSEHLGLVEFCYNSITHSMTKIYLFELTLEKEAKKSMDLTIHVDVKITPRKLWRWSKGMRKNMPKPRNFWSKFKSDMRNMPTKHEGMLNLKLGNMCG
jgi:hypothetical protein